MIAAKILCRGEHIATIHRDCGLLCVSWRDSDADPDWVDLGLVSGWQTICGFADVQRALDFICHTCDVEKPDLAAAAQDGDEE